MNQDERRKLIEKLQAKLAALPVVPLDKRVRNRRDKIARELMRVAREAGMVGSVDLMAGTR